MPRPTRPTVEQPIHQVDEMHGFAKNGAAYGRISLQNRRRLPAQFTRQ